MTMKRSILTICAILTIGCDVEPQNDEIPEGPRGDTGSDGDSSSSDSGSESGGGSGGESESGESTGGASAYFSISQCNEMVDTMVEACGDWDYVQETYGGTTECYYANDL